MEFISGSDIMGYCPPDEKLCDYEPDFVYCKECGSRIYENEGESFDSEVCDLCLQSIIDEEEKLKLV